MNSRIIELNIENINKNNDPLSLEIKQNLDYGFSGEVWDGSLVLSYFLTKNYNKFAKEFKDKTIIELGSGTGIVGIITSIFQPKRIYITDLEFVVPFIKENANHNKSTLDIIGENCYNSIIPKSLDWMNSDNINEFKNLEQHYDYIILSEVIYDETLSLNLLNVLKSLFTKNKTKILLCYTYRKKEEFEFLKKLSKELNVKIGNVPKEDLDSQYQSDDIFVLFMESL